jgi:hypothetical protein
LATYACHAASIKYANRRRGEARLPDRGAVALHNVTKGLAAPGAAVRQQRVAARLPNKYAGVELHVIFAFDAF